MDALPFLVVTVIAPENITNFADMAGLKVFVDIKYSGVITSSSDALEDIYKRWQIMESMSIGQPRFKGGLVARGKQGLLIEPREVKMEETTRSDDMCDHDGISVGLRREQAALG